MKNHEILIIIDFIKWKQTTCSIFIVSKQVLQNSIWIINNMKYEFKMNPLLITDLKIETNKKFL